MTISRFNLVPITSPTDPRVSDYTNLSDRVGIKQFNRFIAEGDLIVRHLIESTYTTRSIFIADYWLPRAEKTLHDLPPDVPVYIAPEPILDQVIGFAFHRGMLACGQTGSLPSTTALIERASSLTILEELSNHDNVGSIFRTVSALGGRHPAVILSADSCHPMYRKSIRVSMGHVLRVPFSITPPDAMLSSIFPALHNAGFTTIALTPAPDAIDLNDLDPRSITRPALILGAEGPGLTPLTQSAAKLRVRIPIARHADSLNVGVAAGIALHHFSRHFA